MNYLLLGAGLQGTAIAHDLLNQAPGTTGLAIVDADADALASRRGVPAGLGGYRPLDRRVDIVGRGQLTDAHNLLRARRVA